MAARTALPMLRTSERKDFKRCPQRWWWAWREGYRNLGPDADALWFGTGWHLVLAHWYKGPGLRRGAQPLKVWRDFVGEQRRFIRTNFADNVNYKEDTYIEAGKLGEAMLENYFDTYGKDETWWVIEPEHSGEVIIPTIDGKGHLIKYCFTYDLVYRDLRTEDIWLGEHKTAKSINLLHLPLDDQAGSYSAVATTELRAAGKLGPKENIQGIMYNFARKSAPDDRPRDAEGMAHNKPVKAHYIEALGNAGIPPGNYAKATIETMSKLAADNNITVLGEISLNQPAKLLIREPVVRSRKERNQQIVRIQNEATAMQMMRSGEIPLYKNPTKDCSWDCNFFNACILHEQGGDFDEFLHSAYRRQDPYANHRKSASGED